MEPLYETTISGNYDPAEDDEYYDYDSYYEEDWYYDYADDDNPWYNPW
jgi:hypothetical protein